MAVTETIATTDLEFARQLGQQLRVDSIRCSTAAGSGHPTSSMSAADLIAVLLTRYLQYDWSKPKDPNNDHLIYSKGHASPLCYAMFKAAGAGTDAEMMTFRKFGSRLQGHPTPVLPWVDVHDMPSIDRAFGEALSNTGKPTVIIAKTIKGKGFSEIENKDGWHGKPLPPDMAERAIKELGGIKNLKVKTQKPERGAVPKRPADAEPVLPTYKKEDKVATRKAHGDAPLALASHPEVVAMDGEVSNSTHADEFAKAHPDRFFEMWIAEQQLVATAVGMSVRGYIPFASTFAAFFSRAYDFVRMAAISQANIRLVGSHARVEIGQDEPSQMALEDLASMRAIQGSTVLYPSDATSTAQLVTAMADRDGVSYIRTTRGAYPVLYE